MSNLDNLATSAGTGEDFTDTSTVSFERDLPREGAALLRLRDYIELGVQQPKNKTYKPRVKAVLVFELLHPDHMITPEGKPAFPQLLYVRVDKSRAMSNFIKLFNAMNHSGEKTHFLQMIGDAFLGYLTHNKSGDTTFVNLNDKSGTWKIGAPIALDHLTNTSKPIPVPELHGTSAYFCWENPGWTDENIVEAWDTLFIEGENDDGKSKNWIQNSIRESLKWEGSRTQAAVDKGVVEVPTELNVDYTATEATVETTEPTAQIDPLAQLGLG